MTLPDAGVALATRERTIHIAIDSGIKTFFFKSAELHPASRFHHDVQVSSSMEQTAVSISADGSTLALGADDGSVVVLSLPRYRVLYKGVIHSQGVTDLNLSHDGRLACTTGRDRLALVWDTHSGTIIQTITAVSMPTLKLNPGSRSNGRRAPPLPHVRTLHFSSAGAHLFAAESGREGGFVSVWRATGTTPAYSVAASINVTTEAITGLSVNDVGSLIAAAISNGHIYVLSYDGLATLSIRWKTCGVFNQSLPPHVLPVTGMCFLQNSTRLVSVSADRSVLLWNIERQVSKRCLISYFLIVLFAIFSFFTIWFTSYATVSKRPALLKPPLLNSRPGERTERNVRGREELDPWCVVPWKNDLRSIFDAVNIAQSYDNSDTSLPSDAATNFEDKPQRKLAKRDETVYERSNTAHTLGVNQSPAAFQNPEGLQITGSINHKRKRPKNAGQRSQRSSTSEDGNEGSGHKVLSTASTTSEELRLLSHSNKRELSKKRSQNVPLKTTANETYSGIPFHSDEPSSSPTSVGQDSVWKRNNLSSYDVGQLKSAPSRSGTNIKTDPRTEGEEIKYAVSDKITKIKVIKNRRETGALNTPDSPEGSVGTNKTTGLSGPSVPDANHIGDAAATERNGDGKIVGKPLSAYYNIGEQVMKVKTTNALSKGQRRPNSAGSAVEERLATVSSGNTSGTKPKHSRVGVRSRREKRFSKPNAKSVTEASLSPHVNSKVMSGGVSSLTVETNNVPETRSFSKSLTDMRFCSKGPRFFLLQRKQKSLAIDSKMTNVGVSNHLFRKDPLTEVLPPSSNDDRQNNIKPSLWKTPTPSRIHLTHNAHDTSGKFVHRRAKNTVLNTRKSNFQKTFDGMKFLLNSSSRDEVNIPDGTEEKKARPMKPSTPKNTRFKKIALNLPKCDLKDRLKHGILGKTISIEE